ncbi:leucyl aminopeptidase [Romboutsia weinsteinii]|uniref:Probable cytosol aminopeptidase n=1 Tax=Romboutsia weinsteinii TaxID=2020949 RepID=A0A371J7Q9_9FIRM|nr:leucyl aminopeptidase [Romboutsia weinsteinii]RDY28821.1 leucyl aminopeptidase [Romboutsia weinsteinii]
MNIKIGKSYLEVLENTVVVAAFKEEIIKSKLEEINIISKEFDAKYNNIEVVKAFIDGKIVTICLVGLGEKEKLNEEKLRVLGGSLVKKLKNIIKSSTCTSDSVDVLNVSLSADYIGVLVEGMLLGNYEFNKYKTKTSEENTIETLTIYTDEEVENEIEKAEILATSTIIARDLVNEPSNVIYPETLANEAVKLGNEYGFEVEVYEQDKIEELGMEAFLAVGRGSSNKPRFIVMRYIQDADNEDILGLVGKGITYDTGGYSIKPTGSMVDMKTDMGGAASVIGAMCAIAKSKLNKNVIAVVAACENSISGNAYKPGDIISSMAKKTIEVLNTDAEGRLTLADAVYYIVNNENVSKVVDVATLTGAAVVALGSVATAVVTNNDEFYEDVKEAADLSGEKIWRMPVFDEYKKLIKGSEADLKNSAGREGGCITAGLFVGEFVGNTPWVHMDIAGTSASNKAQGYKSKGGTGEGVRTLYYLATK